MLQVSHSPSSTTLLALTVSCTYKIDGTVACLEKKSEPISQKMFLHDLPPEIIHHILEAAETKTARMLGATSRLFREIALPHIFRVRLPSL